MWLQLHYTNYITPQLQLHYATTTTTVAVHHTTSSSCGWGGHCNHRNHSNKDNSNHLSVNQWVRSAIRDSQQPTSPIGFLFWNFRHRLVRYYWYYIENFVDVPKLVEWIHWNRCLYTEHMHIVVSISGSVCIIAVTILCRSSAYIYIFEKAWETCFNRWDSSESRALSMDISQEARTQSHPRNLTITINIIIIIIIIISNDK